MIVENESNWRTEDLQALLERVLESPKFKLCPYIDETTLVLFKTARPKVRLDQNGEERNMVVANYDSWPSHYYNAFVIKIRSADKLRLPLLERMAQITSTCEQHMSSENVVQVAHTIGCCLARSNRGVKEDFLWATHMTLRSRSKITHGKIATKRGIAILNMRRSETVTRFNKMLSKIDKRLAKLEKLR